MRRRPKRSPSSFSNLKGPYRNSGAFACSFAKKRRCDVSLHRPHSRAVRRIPAGEGDCNEGAPGGSQPEVRRAGSRLQRELAPRERDGASADLDALEAVGRTVGRREQDRRTADLGALMDLDLFTEPDAAVAGGGAPERAPRPARPPDPRGPPVRG